MTRAIGVCLVRRLGRVLKRETDPKQSSARAKRARGAKASGRRKAGIRAVSERDSAIANRLDALVSLLGDESPTVWDGVQREFRAFGKLGFSTLEKAARSSSPRMRSRARTLLGERDKDCSVRRLARYAVREHVDLERAFFLLSRHHSPRLDPRPYQRALAAMAREVVKRGRSKPNELDRALVLVEYLGNELAIGGITGDFHHPDNIHIHRAIERRAGIPLTLCALYLFVARRAGIKAAILPLPGHVMLRLYGDGKSVIVDPYHHGQGRTHAQCKKYLEQNGLGFHPAWLQPATDAVLFKRQLTNLMRSAKERGLAGDAKAFRSLVRLFEPRMHKGFTLP